MASPHEDRYSAIFAFIPALYPACLKILNKHGVTGPEFFVLSFLKHHGKVTSEGNGILLGDMLEQVEGIRRRSKASSSRALTKLVNAHYIKKVGVTTQERDDKFPGVRGDSTVVVITPQGLDLLLKINEDASKLIDDLATGTIPTIILKRTMDLLQRYSQKLVARLNALSSHTKPSS